MLLHSAQPGEICKNWTEKSRLVNINSSAGLQSACKVVKENADGA